MQTSILAELYFNKTLGILKNHKSHFYCASFFMFPEADKLPTIKVSREKTF